MARNVTVVIAAAEVMAVVMVEADMTMDVIETGIMAEVVEEDGAVIGRNFYLIRAFRGQV